MSDTSIVQDVVVERQATPTALEVQLDAQRVIARIGAIAQVIEGCAKTSIQRTNAQDWVKQTSRDGKESYYLQATGAQKIRPVWGIYYRSREVTKESLPDGSYAYLVTGEVGSKVLDQLYGEVVIQIDGGRSASDGFFTGKDGTKKFDPLDVRKAALANWESRAVTALLGLKNVTAEDLKRNGIDVSGVTSVAYEQGAEGGGQTNVISDAQRKRMWSIGKKAGVSDDQIKALCHAFGFPSTQKVERGERYEAICGILERGPESVSQAIAEKQAPSGVAS